MKILYFFASGFDTPNPSYHLMEAIIEDTLKSGIDVHMISSHITGENDDVPRHLCNYENFTYDIVKRKNVKKDEFIKRYLDGVKYAFDCVPHIRNVRDFDLIYVQSAPTVLFNILVSKWFAKGKPIIYSIQDIFPGSSIHSGVMNRKWMQYIFTNLQKIAYALADKINVISDDMKDKIIEQGVPKEKITVIVDWCDDTKVSEVQWEKNRFVKKYNLSQERFYVQYAGTMGYVFDYETIVKVATILKEYEDIEFQMIGFGSQKEKFERQCEKLGLENVTFYPLQPLDMVSDVYSACSVELIPLKKGVIGNSVPSKASQVMACKRVVINSVDIDSKYYEMFNANKIGISASNEDPYSVAQAILKLYSDKETKSLYEENAKYFGSKYYSRVYNTSKLIKQLKCIVGNHEGICRKDEINDV